MKEVLIGFMGLVFGGRSEDWTPTKQDYAVFFGMIFFLGLSAFMLY